MHSTQPVVFISLYHYGAFGTRGLTDYLREHTRQRVAHIYFKQDKINGMALPTEREYALLVDRVCSLDPLLIGISTRSTFAPVAHEVTGRLKSRLAAPIVWGGAHPTLCPDDAIHSADIVCVGEGEYPLPELIKNLRENRPYYMIHGLWVRQGTDVRANEPPPLYTDLDSLPLPDFSDGGDVWHIEDDSCQPGDPLYNDKLTHYKFMAGRGCPYHCTFCSNSALKEIFRGKGPFIRQRSVAHVMAELAAAKKRFINLRSISSNDEVFGINRDWLREFCRRYATEIRLSFHCDMHPHYVSEDVIADLKNAGLQTITMGIQSGSERVRSAIYGRDTTQEQLKKSAGLFKKYNLFPSLDLIFDNPAETAADILTTFDFMLELPRPFQINMYSLQYHPRTKLTERFMEEGIIKANDIDGVSLKGFNNWRVDALSPKLDPKVAHLYKAFMLLSSSVLLSRSNPGRVMITVPTYFVRMFARSTFLERRPWLTNWIVTVLPKITYAIGLLVQADFAQLWAVVRRKLSSRRRCTPTVGNG